MTEREALKLALDFISRLKFADAEPEPDRVMDTIKETLAQPEQEPVAWKTDDIELYVREDKFGFYNIPLYTSPPQRKPLTDEMTKQMRERCDSYEMRGAFVDGWVSAEVAHGIKE